VTPADASAACDAAITAMRISTGAAIRRYQTQADAFTEAGQPVPPPPPALEGKIRITGGQVQLIKGIPTIGKWPLPIPVTD